MGQGQILAYGDPSPSTQSEDPEPEDPESEDPSERSSGGPGGLRAYK